MQPKAGSVLELKDFETLRTTKMRGAVRKITRIGKIKNQLISIQLIFLDLIDNEIILIAETDGVKICLILDRDEALPRKTREQLCVDGETFLFDDDQVAQLAPIEELKYNDAINSPPPEKFTYNLDTVIDGPYHESPTRQGFESTSLYTQVAIYHTEKEAVNNYRVIFEFGKLDDPKNNIIGLYFGREISPNDVK